MVQHFILVSGSGIFISPKGVARGSGSIGMTMISWVICGLISIIGKLLVCIMIFRVGNTYRTVES
jgi:hypothetical protein